MTTNVYGAAISFNFADLNESCPFEWFMQDSFSWYKRLASSPWLGFSDMGVPRGVQTRLTVSAAYSAQNFVSRPVLALRWPRQ